MKKKDKEKIERLTNKLFNISLIVMLASIWFTQWSLALKMFLTAAIVMFMSIAVSDYAKKK